MQICKTPSLTSSSCTSLESVNSVSDGGDGNEQKAIVVVTPYSSGVCLAKEIALKGYKLICLWNHGFSDAMKLHVPQSCADLCYFAEVDEGGTLGETVQIVEDAAQGREIVAVVCGGEAGVDLTDALEKYQNSTFFNQ